MPGLAYSSLTLSRNGFGPLSDFEVTCLFTFSLIYLFIYFLLVYKNSEKPVTLGRVYHACSYLVICFIFQIGLRLQAQNF